MTSNTQKLSVIVLLLLHSPSCQACQIVHISDTTLTFDCNLLQIQVLWEMKALTDPVDLALLAKARAISEYKTDFNDLSMGSIHVRSSVAASDNYFSVFMFIAGTHCVVRIDICT